MDSQVSITVLPEPLTDLSAVQLRKKIKKESGQGIFLHIIDLRKLTRLDTRTIAEIIRARRGLREVGGALTVVADQREVVKILSIAGLDRVFGVHENMPKAFEALGVSELIPA
ncbi:MAG: STAS domain-containing protein [Candidatus Eremiobacteraeota bacterium]|nr:STAS domain-containing protein [Candidatus Eremiobacteraeota bacterium]MBV8264089.1 STAS domain-containing protein [Candidatus Eremiobacteraeota bacterium]MBV8340072.1 STAS domain-containing protein [Candidatus Eremiobacteraeota bacterium]MBV8459875.1 STAS domain-containing protein [Candidatus Eremiobacteraeota bacterium]MBV8596056.1 STAS domain-containing protein [Candidatus Eremiobacteraeota bacterium]